MQQHYLHCPHCGRLDRIFISNETQRSTCRCGKTSPFKQWITPMEGNEWLAQRIDEEISIVRRSRFHGRISHGWFDKDKVLIAKVGDVEGVAGEVLRIASEEAARRNLAELQSGE